MEKLQAQIRQVKKRDLKVLRKEGRVPGVLYGPTIAATPIAVSAKDLSRVYREAGESSLIALFLENEDTPRTVLIRELQRDPLRSEALHIDFHQVRMDEKLRVRVPLEFIGTAPAEESKEAIIVKNMHEVEIEALPQDLPHEIQVDLKRLQKIDDAILVKDLAIPSGVEVHEDPDATVVLASASTTQEELEKPPEEEVLAGPEGTVPAEQKEGSLPDQEPTTD